MTENSIYSFIKTLRPLYISIENRVRQICNQYDISVSERAILEQLYPTLSLSVPILAEKLLLKRQSVQEVVNQLIAKDLLIILINPAHKKSKLYNLTSKGHSFFSQIHLEEIAFLKQSYTLFSAKDIESATKVSIGLTKIFQEDL